jgi:hypothetical protein
VDLPAVPTPAEADKVLQITTPYTPELGTSLSEHGLDPKIYQNLVGTEITPELKQGFSEHGVNTDLYAKFGRLQAADVPASQRADSREDPRAIRERNLAGDHGKIDQLSWDEYNALSDRERSAVDFNSLLVQAVNKDKRMNKQGAYDDVSDQEKMTYVAALKQQFGDETTPTLNAGVPISKGSDIYAPETLALLNQLDLKDSNANLDDFLNLKVAITAKDIAAMDVAGQRGPGDRPDVFNPVQGDAKDRLQMVQQYASSADQLRDSLVKGNEMLANFRQSVVADRNSGPNPLVTSYGGTATKVNPGVGYGAPTGPDGNMTIDGYFQLAFQSLAAAKADDQGRAAVMDDARKMLKPEELQQFYNYIDRRSAEAAASGAPLGPPGDVQYRSPQEFRELLGIGK